MFIISGKCYLLNRLREVPFFLRGSRASETRARVNVTPREKGRETRLAFNKNYSPASHIVVIMRTDTTSPRLIIIASDLQSENSRETFDSVIIVTR